MSNNQNRTSIKIRSLADLVKAIPAAGQGVKLVFLMGETRLLIRTDLDVNVIQVAGQPDHVEINLHEERRK